MVMFDSLNRRFLPPYGCDWVQAPHFARLAERSVTFDTCYGGSMPCMPARRDLQTGRYNFLHRSWGPLEPFDDSVPQLLGEHGVYTHLVTDHAHYWEDGGATFHQRYRSFEFFRGQEGDPWKGWVEDPPEPAVVEWRRGRLWRQDLVNRSYLADLADHPQTRTFDAGLEFIETNHRADRWFVQIETFDPHEPFFSYEQHKKWYEDSYRGPRCDWPDYKRVTEPPAQVARARNEYAALLTMCDDSLGRVLDAFDRLDLWRDTMLIVCTDHGFLLGEHGWWGKNIQPWFDENIHLPLFVWDPRLGVRGERRRQLVQTIDIGPTLLEVFDLPRPPDMQGRPLRDVIAHDRPIRDGGLFGVFGGHVNVTDGRYVYMRSCVDRANQPLFDYTLMPTHMHSRFSPAELAGAELAPPFTFTKGAPTLRVPGFTMGNPHHHGTMLFDLVEDPGQQHPLADDERELRMAELLVRLMRETDAPPEQFDRLGLPREGAAGPEHLLVRRQWQAVERRHLPPPREDGYDASRTGVRTPLRELVGVPGATAAIEECLGISVGPGLLAMAAAMNPVQLAAMQVGIGDETVADLDRRLAALSRGAGPGSR